MTLLKKLVCKSVKEDLYCDGEYDRRFDTRMASACEKYEPRKKSRQKKSNSQKPRIGKRLSGKASSRQMQIPHVIPEQAGITHKHPEFDDLSENDFVVNAVRKTLNDRPKRKTRNRLLCKFKDANSISTTSSVTVDLTRNAEYYYGHADEGDVLSQEGRALSPAKTLGLAQQVSSSNNRIQPPPASSPSKKRNTTKPPSPTSVVPNYQSERAEEDEGEEYLDQCMGMVADLLVGEAAVPTDPEKRKRIANGQVAAYDSYTAHAYGEDSEVFKTVSSQYTYTDESSRDSYSSGQSSYEDSAFTSEFGSTIF